MEVAAKLKGAAISAQKARLVADQIRGKNVEEALDILTFSPKKAAVLVKKVLNSAIANARMHENLFAKAQSEENLAIYANKNVNIPANMNADAEIDARPRFHIHMNTNVTDPENERTASQNLKLTRILNGKRARI